MLVWSACVCAGVGGGSKDVNMCVGEHRFVVIVERGYVCICV